MDLALCIEKLVPSAKYGGSTTDNSKACYDRLRWEDKRNKPTWEELLAVSDEVDAEREKKIKVKSLEERIIELEKKL